MTDPRSPLPRASGSRLPLILAALTALAALVAAAWCWQRKEHAFSLGLVSVATAAIGLVVRRELKQRTRAVEEHLRVSEIRYRRLFEAAHDGVLLVDPATARIIDANPSMTELIGRPHQELIGKELFEVGLLPDAATNQRMLAALREQSDVRYNVLSLASREGEKREVEIVANCYQENGHSIIQCNIRDISERMRAETALRESEERFRGMANAMPQLAWIARADGHIFWYNRRWYEYTGTTAQQMEGWGWQSVHDAEELPKVLERWKASIAAAEPFEMTFPLRSAKGGLRPFLTRAVPLKDASGQVAQWFGTNTDISDLKEAEAKWRASDQRARLATEATGVGIWEWNVLAGSIQWDAEMFRIYGVTPTPDGAVSYNVWKEAVHPEDLAVQEALLQETVRRGGQSNREFRIRRASDGEWRHLQAVETVRTNARGETEWVVGTNLDITERKQAENTLRETKEAAEAANRSKDRFLAVLSHELRTPLTPVLLAVSALEQDAALPAEVRDDLTMIKRNIELETKLIDDLLDITRIATGKLVVELAPLDINSAVRQACGNFQAVARARGVQLEMTLDPAAAGIHGDPARLQQVLWNVLRNALKFTPKRGRVAVSTARLSPERCEIRVRDSGIGIASEGLSVIFGAFEQGGTSVTRQYGGLGLGLAICKAIMEAHGGSIRAESAGVGEGATFILEFRAAPPQPAPSPLMAATGSSSPSPQIRLLLVEDHLDTARTLQRLLQRAGIAVTHATDIATGVAAACAGRFDVLVSDLGLPDGTGCELMERLRAERPIPGIAMSGYGMPQDLQRTREAGFAEHLVKPIDVSQLLAAISRMVRPKAES